MNAWQPIASMPIGRPVEIDSFPRPAGQSRPPRVAIVFQPGLMRLEATHWREIGADAPRARCSYRRHHQGAIMRRFIVFVLAYGLAALSAIWAARYGFKAADTEFDAYLRGGALCAIAFFAVHSQAWAFSLWNKGARGWGFLTGCVGMICFAVTLAGGIGTLASSSDQLSAAREQESDRARDDKAELARLLAERDKLPDSRPILTLTPLLDTLKAHQRFKSSNGCDPAAITREDTRAHCADFRRIEAEIGTTKARADLDARVAKIRTQLAKPQQARMVDPQAVQISRLLGISPEKAQALYAGGVSLALELSAVFTMLVNEIQSHRAVIVRRLDDDDEDDEAIDAEFTEAASAPAGNVVAIPQHPEGIVSRFIREGTEHAEGASAAFAELYGAYLRWCELSGRKPHDSETFAAHFAVICRAAHIDIEGEGDGLRARDLKLVA